MEKRQLLVREEAVDDLDDVEGLVGPVNSNHGAHSRFLRGKACQPSLPIELNDQASLGRRPHVKAKPIRSNSMSFGKVTVATDSRGEIITEAARDDPPGQRPIVASEGLSADGRNLMILITPAQFFDRAIDSYLSGRGKLVHQVPDLFVGLGTCR